METCPHSGHLAQGPAQGGKGGLEWAVSATGGAGAAEGSDAPRGPLPNSTPTSWAWFYSLIEQGPQLLGPSPLTKHLVSHTHNSPGRARGEEVRMKIPLGAGGAAWNAPATDAPTETWSRAPGTPRPGPSTPHPPLHTHVHTLSTHQPFLSENGCSPYGNTSSFSPQLLLKASGNFNCNFETISRADRQSLTCYGSTYDFLTLQWCENDTR